MRDGVGVGGLPVGVGDGDCGRESVRVRDVHVAVKLMLCPLHDGVCEVGVQEGLGVGVALRLWLGVREARRETVAVLGVRVAVRDVVRAGVGEGVAVGGVPVRSRDKVRVPDGVAVADAVGVGGALPVAVPVGVGLGGDADSEAVLTAVCEWDSVSV